MYAYSGATVNAIKDMLAGQFSSNVWTFLQDIYYRLSGVSTVNFFFEKNNN